MNDAIRALVHAGVRFVVIGGHAMRLTGMPRTTMDWDLFVPPRDESNFKKINQALENDLDMDVLPLGPRGEYFIQTFQTQWAVLQFHLGVPGVPPFDEAEAAAVEVAEDGVLLKRLSGAHLLAAKEKADRSVDQADLRFLRLLKADGKLV
jgi:hypothetical protein